jgi:hypothetical protein
MNRGSLGIRELNVRLQNELNPARADEPVVEKFGWQFRVRDKVIQTENNYDKDVFNGDIGQIAKIDEVEREVRVKFDQREVVYDFGELDELSLAYAIIFIPMLALVAAVQGSPLVLWIRDRHAWGWGYMSRLGSKAADGNRAVACGQLLTASVILTHFEWKPHADFDSCRVKPLSLQLEQIWHKSCRPNVGPH